jgi:hypothetical protein
VERLPADLLMIELGPTFSTMSEPPDDLPRYRVPTGPEDETFCRRVSEALERGHVLHAGPAVTLNAMSVIVALALIWPTSR